MCSYRQSTPSSIGRSAAAATLAATTVAAAAMAVASVAATQRCWELRRRQLRSRRDWSSRDLSPRYFCPRSPRYFLPNVSKVHIFTQGPQGFSSNCNKWSLINALSSYDFSWFTSITVSFLMTSDLGAAWGSLRPELPPVQAERLPEPDGGDLEDDAVLLEELPCSTWHLQQEAKPLEFSRTLA